MNLQLGTRTRKFGVKPDVIEIADYEINDYVDCVPFRQTLSLQAIAENIPADLLKQWERTNPPDPYAHLNVPPEKELLNPHTAVFGLSGSGKTQFMLSLIQQHFQKGESVIAVDPQLHTLQSIAQAAMNAKVPKERITFLTPLETSYIAGWNPLVIPGQPIADSVDDLMTLFQGVFSDSWGYRLEMVLNKSLTILATHGLSLYELAPFLQNEPYRTGLLTQVKSAYPPGRLYEEARHYFLNDFSKWSRSEQNTAVGPVINKVDAMLRNDFFFGTFCGYKGEQSSFRFADFWKEQRVLLVHMAEGKFDPTGIKLLGALVAQQLYRTSLLVGKGAPRDVVLWLDEMGVQGRHFGTTLQNILRIARAQQLHLLMAGQDLEQFESHVLTSLMGAATRVFFQLIGQDAKRIAADLSETMSEAKTFPKQRLRISAVANNNHLVLDKIAYPIGTSKWPSDQEIKRAREDAARYQQQASDSAKQVEEGVKRIAEIQQQLRPVLMRPETRRTLETALRSAQNLLAAARTRTNEYAAHAQKYQQALDALLSERHRFGGEREKYYLGGDENIAWLESWLLYHDPRRTASDWPKPDFFKRRTDAFVMVNGEKVWLRDYLNRLSYRNLLISFGRIAAITAFRWSGTESAHPH